MKTPKEKGKLRLVKQTVRTLSHAELEAVVGGTSVKRKTAPGEEQVVADPHAFDGQ